RSTKHQTIRGIGAFYNEPRWLDLFANDMGASAVRLGIIENEWEPVNDNDDPNVLNMEGFNYDAFDWQYIRDLKAAGVETFILTSWSPPAWMKRSLTLNHSNQAIVWEQTDNILEPYYYDEFAESMVAVVKAFKEEADVDLLAIGLQNEPFFNEPYASAILGPNQFHKLIEVVGDRFAKEGLEHVGFFMPEQVFGFFMYTTKDYLAAVRANPKADSYTDYIGVHGYDGTGVDANFPTYDGWTSLWNTCNQGDYPKELWMTETHIGYENYNSALSFAGALHGSLYAGNISLWTNWSFGDVQLTKNVPNSTFYATKQYARYVRPGAVRVGSESDHAKLLVTAFENPDGKLAIVVINTGTGPVSVKLEGDNLPYGYDVVRTMQFENAEKLDSYLQSEDGLIFPARSITTLISNDAAELYITVPEDVQVNNTDGEQQVIITGISYSDGSTEGLELSYSLEDSTLFSSVQLSAINASGEASFTFVPGGNEVEGSTRVNLVLDDDKGNFKHVYFTITVNRVEGTASVREQEFMLYPNPATEFLYAVLPGNTYTSVNVRDLSGKMILEFVPVSDHIKLNVSDLESGMYIFEAVGTSGKTIANFIKR
ncbi:glycoside hydrolase family 30 beta sandwich domain-containing protein, partial [Bacteroidota bacterium]